MNNIQTNDKMQQNTTNRKVRVLLGSHHFFLSMQFFLFQDFSSADAQHRELQLSPLHAPVVSNFTPLPRCVTVNLKCVKPKLLCTAAGAEKSLDTAKHLWLAELITALNFPSAMSLGTITTSSHQRPLVHWRRYCPNSKFTFVPRGTTHAKQTLGKANINSSPVTQPVSRPSHRPLTCPSINPPVHPPCPPVYFNPVPDRKPAHSQVHQSICQVRQSINNWPFRGSILSPPHLSSWHTNQTKSGGGTVFKKEGLVLLASKPRLIFRLSCECRVKY